MQWAAVSIAAESHLTTATDAQKTMQVIWPDG